MPALLLLLPTAYLFNLVWQSNSEAMRFGALERHGVEYTDALMTVELAVTEAQLGAATGQTVAKDNLTKALNNVTALDQRYGGELRSSERWAELRTNIESLLNQNNSGKTGLESFGNTADLLLALIEKVRNTSKLIRDPTADTYYLQDAAAQELPEGVVAMSNLSALAIITSKLKVTERASSVADLLNYKSGVESNINDLADDLRETVDSTSSRTLGSNLLKPLDRFRQAANALIPAATPSDTTNVVLDANKVSQSWKEAHEAAKELSQVMLAETNGLLANRVDTLSTKNTEAIGSLVLVVLLAVGVPVLLLFRKPRVAPSRLSGTDVSGPGNLQQRQTSGVYPQGQFGQAGPHGPGGPQPPGGMPVNASSLPPHADLAALSAWERSGAAR